MRVMQWVRAVTLVLVLAGTAAPLLGQFPGVGAQGALPQTDEADLWRDALIAVPLAAVLGAALAFRPVRRGTPARDPAVIQTQIILAVVGAVIMIVVGASIARAFGILGAANLVRYRAKIDDPKDAAVMLVALAVGLATGVGVYWIAAGSTAFILALLWGLESFEPAPRKALVLKVSGKEIGERRSAIERILRAHDVKFENRTLGQEELAYDVELPARKRTDKVGSAIKDLEGADESGTTVEWENRKKGK
ncbi:MAG TPA: MgtC/SapB family protein [Gemmatimonadales bacterium]|nr:MgtC/SapB family protein [Gemmatimonadales bacterium]